MLSSGSPYDLIVSSLGVHTLAGHGLDEKSAVPKYRQVFYLISEALLPGGHFIYADHVGILPLYRQSQSGACIKA